MARFRLTAKHYLHIEGMEWEHKETNQQGEEVRTRFPVPKYLDPDNPMNQNYPGEIIVTLKKDRAFPKDLLFTGKPTPDMEPLDDEADAMIAELRPHWAIPVESLSGNYGEDLLAKLSRQLDAMAAGGSNASVGRLEQLEAQNKALQDQINEMMELLRPKITPPESLDEAEVEAQPEAEAPVRRRA